MLDAVPKQLYIAGAWRDGAEGATVAVEDPATGETIAVGRRRHGRRRARRARRRRRARSRRWRETAPRERGEILRRAYERDDRRAPTTSRCS